MGELRMTTSTNLETSVGASVCNSASLMRSAWVSAQSYREANWRAELQRWTATSLVISHEASLDLRLVSRDAMGGDFAVTAIQIRVLFVHSCASHVRVSLARSVCGEKFPTGWCKFRGSAPRQSVLTISFPLEGAMNFFQESVSPESALTLDSDRFARWQLPPISWREALHICQMASFQKTHCDASGKTYRVWSSDAHVLQRRVV